MTTPLHRPNFNFKWTSLSHYDDPYGDILWHIFWGIIIFISVIYSIITKDFLFLILTLISLIFFFHPFFYQSIELDIELNTRGIKVNENFYKWEEFKGFEIFYNGDRYLIYFISKQPFHLGLTLPLEPYLSIKEIRETLREIFDEYINAVPWWEKWYRNFFK
ncbi:MAG: hypothetical protein KatS3mg095_0087 [Candidatus Parcubacteria bacterium]|nr:MAG: hypothetical protein KatS3mg095_0087 [Candidatus Parcubacteria bacterium]